MLTILHFRYRRAKTGIGSASHYTRCSYDHWSYGGALYSIVRIVTSCGHCKHSAKGKSMPSPNNSKGKISETHRQLGTIVLIRRDKEEDILVRVSKFVECIFINAPLRYLSSCSRGQVSVVTST